MWLGNKPVALVGLLIAVISKSVIALSYSSLKGDKSLYLLFAKSFLETGVLVEPVQVFEDGSSYYLYNSAVHSPLYSILAAPFLWLTKSYFLTQYILSVLSWIIFYTALYYVVKLVFRHTWQVAAFLLCSAFFIYPHELASPPKDTFAMGFVLWSIFLIHRLVRTNPGLFDAVFLAVTLAGLVAIKLLYIPIAIALFAVSLFLLLKQWKTHLLHAGILFAMLLLIFTLAYFFVLEPAKGFANPTIQLTQNSINTGGGFHPDYLQYTFPFITSSLFNTHLYAVQIERLTTFSFTDVMQFFVRIDAVLFIGCLVLLIALRKRIIGNLVITLLICTSLVMISAVFALSITGQGTTYKSTGKFWTFVMDARSFLLPMITLQIGLFLFVFELRKLRLLRIAAFLLFTTTCVHGFYFTVKEALTLKKGSDEISNDAQTRIIAMMNSQKQNTSPKLVTSDHFLRRYAQVNNLEVYSFSNLSPTLSWINKGDHFLIATFPQDSVYRKYFQPGELMLIDTIQPFVLHRYTVK